MNQKIRIATHNDWSTISRISSASGYEDYINEIGESYLDEGQILLFERESGLGFLMMEEMQDGSMWLSGLRVDPACRRQGVADSLEEAAETFAQLRGLLSVRMLIYSDNAPSIKLVEKHGYVLVEKLKLCEGSINIAGLQESTPVENTLVNVGWKFIKSRSELKDSGRFLTDKGKVLFHYNDEHFTFYQPISGSFKINEGDGMVFVNEKLWKDYPDMEHMDMFEEAVIYEKQLKN